jgi:hypothetical protein
MPIPDEFRDDPVLGPLVHDLEAANARVNAHETRLKAHEDQWLRDRYTGQLGGIAARHNARFKDKPFDQKSFLDFAVGTGSTNLDVAYRAWVAEDLVALECKEAEERGIRRGEREARRSRFQPPRRPAGLPESLQDLKDEDVLADPEIAQHLRDWSDR